MQFILEPIFKVDIFFRLLEHLRNTLYPLLYIFTFS